MEIKNLKMTYNMEYSDCVEASFPIIMNIIAQKEGIDEQGKLAKNIQTVLTEWKSFFLDMVREIPDQFTLIRSCEIFVAHNDKFKSSFHLII